MKMFQIIGPRAAGFGLCLIPEMGHVCATSSNWGASYWSVLIPSRLEL